MDHRLWLGVALSIYFLGSPCFAQGSPETYKRFKDVGDRYNECVYSSAISLLHPGSNDVNKAAEMAFDSCNSETALMKQVMRENGFSEAQMATVFLDKNTGIKRELRKMVFEAQNPKK